MEINEIILEEYFSSCADGCCSDYGTIVTVNGVELESRDLSTEVILCEVLKALGVKADIIVRDWETKEVAFIERSYESSN